WSTAGTIRSGNQGEGWGRVTVHHDGLGASAVVGGLALTGERRATTVGGTLWGTWGVTLAGSGAWTRYDDGAAWQAGGTLTVPVQPWLRVGGGAGATGFTADADATSTEDGGPHLSGHAFASLTRGPVSVGLSGTFGQEVRPIRLSDPTIYNLGYVVSGTGSLDLGVRVAGPVSVVGGYDLLHLVSTGTDPMFVHYVTLGVVVSATRERSEEVR
ncbi:MAG TPA: hypothetical protein PKA64_18340, partial [Myxococcota bacterium]|nr:hypothetical protein [Myxococcota bacterium]